jgi:hypothetical protein
MMYGQPGSLVYHLPLLLHCVVELYAIFVEVLENMR